MTNNTYPQPVPFTCRHSNYPECIASEVIWKTIPVVLFVIGNLGNALSITVLCRRQIRKYSMAAYLLFLSLSDLAFLWSSVLRNTLYRGYGIDLKELSVLHCKLNYWVTLSSGAFSIYIVTVLTIERAVLTKWSWNSPLKSSPYRVRIMLSVVAVLISAVNSHLIYGHKSVSITTQYLGTTNGTVVQETRKCVFVSASYQRFYFTSWNYIVLFVFNIIPVCIIGTGNVVIAINIWKQKAKINTMSVTCTNSQQDSRAKTATRTLFILSAFYILTITPYCTYMIVQNKIVSSLNDKQMAALKLVETLVFMLGYCNFSFNFFMYSSGASLFRKEWEDLVRCSKTWIRNRFQRVREIFT